MHSRTFPTYKFRSFNEKKSVSIAVDETLVKDVSRRALFAVVENMKSQNKTSTQQHRRNILKYGAHSETIDLT